ncbi:MAG TPA: polyhydroxyalkanoate depolymerase [Rhizomicrobium sp.]|nr:polyhydroxyalkanoate depolymerase [Rhizomicrobium sp.]
MLYQVFQFHEDMFAPFRAFSEIANVLLRKPMAGPWANGILRYAAGAFELAAHNKLTHRRPDFGIGHVVMGDTEFAVHEEIALETPFASLLHFKKDGAPKQPPVLIAAPMAGHFATLLKDTIRALLPEHDVYVTDWKNARDIPRDAGHFGMDDYIDHIIMFLEKLGPDAHVVGVCQPCAAVLAAISVMAQNNSPAQPKTMTLMAGPIDTRINPTVVNEYATSEPIEWFERYLISTVPFRYAGAGRRVYPGFIQVGAFLSMNMPRHLRAHLDLFDDLISGNDTKADATRQFYDEYFAVFDLPAEFYLETVQRVFQEHLLPRGLLEYRGKLVDPGAIRKTALLTVEGGRDDICSVGQTSAAHGLCTGIAKASKRQHIQKDVGHYGVFSGRRWQQQIAPKVRAHIAG